jgi:hypothetical protein
MTSKEKAKYLVDKYLDIDSKYEYLSYSMAKQCALIAVDEILEAVMYLDDDSDNYWFEVKQEIEQL